MATQKKTFTFNQVQKELASGRALLVYNGKVYEVTKWMKVHPGGELLIRHMLGRDATDQILTNHSEEVLRKYLPLFHVGNLLPSEAGKYYDRPLSLAFRKLYAKVKDEGLYVVNPWYYVKIYMFILTMLLSAISTILLFGDSFIGCTVGAAFLALCWHQSAGVMHDTGHNAVSHERLLDNAVGLIFTNCLTGLSIGWWKSTHFTHHLVTNDPEHDPHIQLMPFIAVTTRFFESLYSSYHKRVMPYDTFSKWMVRIQHFTFIPLMCVARFVIYKDSITHLIKNKGPYRLAEVVGLFVFWGYFFFLVSLVPATWLRVYFFFLPSALMLILQLQLFISHNSMSTDQMGPNEDFASFQLRTTLDFHCQEWLDPIHGGLQFQVAHHFFPRLPRPNLRQATEHVLQFVKEHNLEYHSYSFADGNVKLLGHLKAIAEEAKFLAGVAKQQYDTMKTTNRLKKVDRG